MPKFVIRSLQATLTSVGGLVVVPVAINVGTGGTLPAWLRPLDGQLWWIASACVASIIALELWERRSSEPARPASLFPHDDPRNRPLAIAQVRRYVDARLAGSLPERLRVALSLDERPAAVEQPFHLVQRLPGQGDRSLSGVEVAGVFEDMDESLLILGAPGAGKTTLLLELAAALLNRAAEDPHQRLPVLIDLADWSRAGTESLLPVSRRASGPGDLAEWLPVAMSERYRIPEAVGRTWLENDRLILLFDGLDEVAEPIRQRCVAQLNELQRRAGFSRIAVASRVAEYDELTARLRLQGAVVIQPLSEEQIVDFFARVSPRLRGIADALDTDPALWELLQSPLMLNIMALTYRDRDVAGRLFTGNAVTRRIELFDAYIVEIFARRRSRPWRDVAKAIGAIRGLALTAARMDTGVTLEPVDTREIHTVFGWPVRQLYTGWVAHPSVLLCCIIVGISTGLFTNTAATGVYAGTVLLLITLLAHNSTNGLNRWRLFPRVRGVPALRSIRLLIGWLTLVAGAAIGFMAGVRWASAELTAQTPVFRTITWSLLFIVALVPASVLVLTRGSWVVFRSSRPAGRAWTTLVLSLLFMVPFVVAALFPAIANGFVPGLLVLTVARFCSEHPHDPDIRTTETETETETLNGWQFAVTIAGLPFALSLSYVPFWFFTGTGRFPDFDPWIGFAGWWIGALVGIVLIPFTEILHVRASRLAMYMAREPYPYRRSVLRLAVDRSLLEIIDGQYRFIHLLIRDHLATCQPALLAEAVRKRQAESADPARPS
ncbi:NACHT domain-containing protein [Dactylosporangium salmoneum]|uniref:NACHT domain-containing protein n=1 Tax=Dactylosporangium salmoneum TaxID=53361 RepID=A0ABN3H5D8_9ACTN